MFLVAWEPCEAQERDLAPLDDALTLVEFRFGRDVHTLLVTSLDAEAAEGIDLDRVSGREVENPLALVSLLGYDRIAGLVTAETQQERVARHRLVVPGVLGEAHIGVGANYVEHGEEAGVDEVFLFPKFSPPSASPVNLEASPGALLDYEVELCARFDRAIAHMGDFEDAVMGLFLCADMTDRAGLLRNVRFTDVASGMGFPEAKSGTGRMPVGYLTVVPRDWRRFLAGVELMLSVNGEPRQRAPAASMIRDLETLVADALAAGDEPRFRWQGRPVALLPEGVLLPSQAILSGTPGGVIFREPGMAFVARRAVKWLATFRFLRQGMSAYLAEEIIAVERARGAYLEAGDVVQLRASFLGEITVNVIEPDGNEGTTGVLRQ